MRRNRIISGVFALTILAATAVCGVSRADDQADIKALEDRFVAAVNARDVEAVMACYQQGGDLVVFDLIPPLQYKGATAWQKDWEGFFADNPGVKVTVSDLDVATNGELGFGHNLQRFETTDKSGKTQVMTLRVSDGYRNVNGKWLIAHEHISVPVDIATGKADMNAK